MTNTSIAEATNGEQIAAEGAEVVQSVVETKYLHTTYIDPATGTYDCDCSGYVTYVLQQIAPQHLALIPKESDWDRPRAFKYYEFFASLGSNTPDGWHQIFHLHNCRPGGMIAWAETTEDPPPAGEDTGHVLIVAEQPEPVSDNVMSVPVYDSSDVLHYDDSRVSETGVGSGVLMFQIDADGRPTAVQFNANEIFRSHPIAIGRLEPLV